LKKKCIPHDTVIVNRAFRLPQPVPTIDILRTRAHTRTRTH